MLIHVERQAAGGIWARAVDLGGSHFGGLMLLVPSIHQNITVQRQGLCLLPLNSVFPPAETAVQLQVARGQKPPSVPKPDFPNTVQLALA